jgi:hypothetical protein
MISYSSFSCTQVTFGIQKPATPSIPLRKGIPRQAEVAQGVPEG